MNTKVSTLLSFCVILAIIACTTPGVNGQKSIDKCSLPAVSGNCLAAIPSYYYDSRSGRCKTFLYGGCRGNSNRFSTLRECNKLRQSCLRRRG